MNEAWTPQEIAAAETTLRDVLAGSLVMPVVLVAHEIGLYDFLGQKARSLAEVCERFQLEPRAAEGMLSMCASAGILQQDQGRFELCALGRLFFLEDSPYSFGAYWDMLLKRRALFSYDSIKDALLSGTPSFDRVFQTTPHSEEEGWAEAFTAAMHARGQAPARVWPTRVDLSEHRVMLDIGGGSGVYSLEAVRKWPELSAVVLEREPVCPAAQIFIDKAGLQNRVRTQPGDFWAEAELPQADLHFYSEVFHNHSLEQCRLLSQKSFHQLPPGGRIMIHEMLLDEEKNGPLVAAAASVNMLVWSPVGKQHTFKELRAVLEGVGFQQVETTASSGYFSITSARKRTEC